MKAFINNVVLSKWAESVYDQWPPTGRNSCNLLGHKEKSLSFPAHVPCCFSYRKTSSRRQSLKHNNATVIAWVGLTVFLFQIHCQRYASFFWKTQHRTKNFEQKFEFWNWFENHCLWCSFFLTGWLSELSFVNRHLCGF